MNELLSTFHFLISFADKNFLLKITEHERSELLDKIIQQGPSKGSWGAILELFASWPQTKSKTYAIERVQKPMSSWSTDICQINSSWRYLFEGDQLACFAKLAKLIIISGRHQYGNSELKNVVQSKNAINLHRLLIHNSEIYEDGVKAITKSPFLELLSELYFENITMGLPLIDQLSSAKNLILTSLKLKDVGMRTEKVRLLCNSPLLVSLKSLDLSYNSLDDESMKVIASCESTMMLYSLNLKHNYISNLGLTSLLDSQYLTNLKTLNISENQISEDVINRMLNMYSNLKIVFI